MCNTLWKAWLSKFQRWVQQPHLKHNLLLETAPVNIPILPTNPMIPHTAPKSWLNIMLLRKHTGFCTEFGKASWKKQTPIFPQHRVRSQLLRTLQWSEGEVCERPASHLSWLWKSPNTLVRRDFHLSWTSRKTISTEHFSKTISKGNNVQTPVFLSLLWEITKGKEGWGLSRSGWRSSRPFDFPPAALNLREIQTPFLLPRA